MNITTTLHRLFPALVARSARRGARLAAGVAVTVASAALLTLVATPASAQVDAGGAFAYENVFCDSVNHRVTVTTHTVGYGSGDFTGGTLLFPAERQLPVWVRLNEYVNGKWLTTSWVQRNGLGQVVMSIRGTTYWYIDYAFQTKNNTLVYLSEWAGGARNPGWYSDQRGYNSLTSCVS
jgi:hypothetical protein